MISQAEAQDHVNAVGSLHQDVTNRAVQAIAANAKKDREIAELKTEVAAKDRRIAELEVKLSEASKPEESNVSPMAAAE